MISCGMIMYNNTSFGNILVVYMTDRDTAELLSGYLSIFASDASSDIVVCSFLGCSDPFEVVLFWLALYSSGELARGPATAGARG